MASTPQKINYQNVNYKTIMSALQSTLDDLEISIPIIEIRDSFNAISRLIWKRLSAVENVICQCQIVGL